MDMTKIKENKLKSEEYGYSSSNFAAAFKKHLDISLAGFRKLSEQKVEESSFPMG